MIGNVVAEHGRDLLDGLIASLWMHDRLYPAIVRLSAQQLDIDRSQCQQPVEQYRVWNLVVEEVRLITLGVEWQDGAAGIGNRSAHTSGEQDLIFQQVLEYQTGRSSRRRSIRSADRPEFAGRP